MTVQTVITGTMIDLSSQAMLGSTVTVFTVKKGGVTYHSVGNIADPEQRRQGEGQENIRYSNMVSNGIPV
jgi:hypothetical protein